jgi:hypothetical protein
MWSQKPLKKRGGTEKPMSRKTIYYLIMKKYKNFVIIIAMFLGGCNFSSYNKEVEKTEFKGKIKILTLLFTNPFGNQVKYFLQEDTVIYFLNFQPNTIFENLSKPYSNNDCHYNKIENEDIYIHSSSTYIVNGVNVSDSATKKYAIDDPNKSLVSVKNLRNIKTVNVTMIKEEQRGTGPCKGYLCMGNTDGGLTIVGDINLESGN